MDQISLDTTQPPEQLQLGGSPPPPSEAVATSRAAKANVGLGVPYADTYKQLLDGEEASFRAQAASNQDVQNAASNQQRLTQIAAQKGRDLTMDEVHQYLTNPKANPDTVIEHNYASGFMGTIHNYINAHPDTQFSYMVQRNPDEVQDIQDAATHVLGLREYMLKRTQDIQNDVDNDSWARIPFIKTPFTPDSELDIGSKTAPWSSAINWATLGIYGGLREEYLMRGNTPDTSRLAGLFEGSNINEQAHEILTSPRGKELFDTAFERLRGQDPALAQQWAAGIIGMSHDEITARNAMSAINIAGGIGAGKAISTALQSAGKASIRSLGRPTIPAVSADDIYRGLETPELWAVRDSIGDILHAAPTVPTKTAVAEAVGDTHEAAIQKTIASFAHPNPEKDAIDTLFSMHTDNQQAIKDNAGNLSREEHTRMLDAGEGYEQDAVRALIETTKVIEQPQLAENGFRDIADNGKEYFRGKENTIVDIDVATDPITGKQHYVYTLANYDGQPFISEQAARIHAETNGYGSPYIVGKNDTVYIPQSAVIRPAELSEPNAHYTGFISPEEQTALNKAVHEGKYGERYEDGNLKLYTDSANGVFVQTRNNAKVGDIPVSYTRNTKGTKGQPRIKYGKPIEHLNEPNPEFRIEEREGLPPRFMNGEAEISPRLQPEPTDLPYNLVTKKFDQPLPYGPQIHRRGVGYNIKWSIPVNSTEDAILDKVIGPRTQSATTEAKTSRSSRMVNGLLGYLRLPADTLSAAENENRAKVVYSQNRYLQLAKGQMKYIEDLYHGLLDSGPAAKSLSYVGNLTGRNREVWNDFVRALTVAQTAKDPATGLPGYYMKTPSEIQHFWQSHFKRPASYAEQMAYLAASRFDYTDWVYRNVAVVRNKFNLGIMNHTLNDVIDGQKKVFANLDGRFVKRIPEGADRTVVYHDGAGGTRFYNSMNTDAKKAVREEFNTGQSQVIQLYDPDSYPIKLRDKDGNHIRVGYIITKNVETNPISYKQVGYRGGGHWDYNYERYLKQPIIRKQTVNGRVQHIYAGDATFAPIGNKLDGDVAAAKLSEIRRLLRDKRIGEAKTLHQAHFDQEWKDFVKHFYPRKNRATGEIEPSRFNLNEDFRVVPKGYTIAQWDKSLIAKYKKSPAQFGTFIDATKEQSLARNFQVEYTGARDSHDLFEPYNTGTIQNPMYKFKPAELVDPITTMDRSLKRITNSLLMDPYKNSAVQHWLEENMHLLDEDPKQVRASPYWYFLNSKLKRGAGLEGQIAESNRYKIRKLVGMPTYFDSLIHDMKQEFANAIYEADSQGLKGKLKKTYLVPPSWMLGKINSPTNLVRGLAFHENLGLFNWAQLAAQNMGWINVFAMSPTHAPSAMFASWMHIWSRVNASPKFLSHLDKMAGTFGWRPGEWQQAMLHYRQSGFDQLGNSLVIDNPNKQNFMLGAGKTLLRNGTIFFDLAEQNVRHGAWYAAYHEFKRAYPNQAIGDVEIGKILNRANNIYQNMGRDSRTMLNTGLTSMTLQFYKYIENVGQQFFSKRIGDVFGKENTWQLRAQQRAQMILMYSLAFGPTGATGLSLLPTSNWIRRYALADGYVPGENFLSTLLMEGPLSMAGAYASGWWRTGSPDMSKGTFYNYNNRYGANGYQLFDDILGDSPMFWKIIMGASGTSLYNTMQSLSPFVYAITSSYNDEQNAPFAVTFEDWKGLARNANSFRQADRLAYALEFGKWIDRHGRTIQKIGEVDAILRTLLGTNDVKVDDAYLKQQISSSEKTRFTQAEKDYNHYRQLAEQAALNKDPEQAKIFNRNAIFVLKSAGVPPEEAAKIFRNDAYRNKETLKQTNDLFYGHLVPLERQGAAQHARQQTFKEEQ